jgi:hypothetical protein
VIFSKSAFIFDIVVNETNQFFDFTEGLDDFTATLRVGRYTLTTIASEVTRAMNEVSSNNYSASINRTRRVITISGDANFELLVTTGINGDLAYLLFGFSGPDRTGAASYEGNVAIGRVYLPQFKLQNYVDFEDLQRSVQASVLESASGQVEVIKFGVYKLMECEIDFATDIDQGFGGPIETNLNGVSDLRTFLIYATSKGAMEFIPDRMDFDVFRKVILESTSESQDGVSFRLREKFAQGLVGYFTTGPLVFREVI